MAKAIIGLGNPGAEYADTRHNAGFQALDMLAEQLGVTYWKNQCGCLLALLKRNGEELLLAKPQAFMNLSGGPIKQLATRYDIAAEDLIIIHDESDLEPGDVRVKREGGHAGHNGLKSINEKLGTNSYPRVRVGIGHPPGRMQLADYVLQDLRGETFEAFLADCKLAAEEALFIVDEGVTPAMDKFNGLHKADKNEQ